MWVGLLQILACGKNDQDSAAIAVDLAPCGFVDAQAGTIDVAELADLFHGGVYAQIQAVLYEATYPSFTSVTLEEGACRYYGFTPMSCDPGCSGGEVCTAEGVCAAFPETVAGGTLAIAGLAGLDQPVSIEPVAYSPGTYNGPAGLPSTLFLTGDPIGATLEGGDLGSMALGALGVAAPDESFLAATFELVDGQDNEVTWSAGTDPDVCAQVVLNGFNQTHGAPLSDVIVCEGTDTGSLVIPQALVEAFPYGETPEVTEGYDWPHSTFTRYTRSRTDSTGGPIELLVRSTTSFRTAHDEP